MNEDDDKIPIQYRNGRTEFMGIDIKVDPRVLVPRPETELLVSVTSDLLKTRIIERPLIADIGTGSGAIAIALADLVENGRIIASDISLDALDVARENVRNYGKSHKITLMCSDLFAAFYAETPDKFDAIVSNPPYVSEGDYSELDAWVKAEPKTALCGGKEGMDILKRIASESPKVLLPGGFVAVEVGYDQADKMKKEFIINGFENIKSYRDFNDYERVIVGWKRG
ncbi:MAG: peptide chain release factor N(5)-glutamine methyltransferase [Candidatus Omnitrophota bacterium]